MAKKFGKTAASDSFEASQIYIYIYLHPHVDAKLLPLLEKLVLDIGACFQGSSGNFCVCSSGGLMMGFLI